MLSIAQPSRKTKRPSHTNEFINWKTTHLWQMQ